MKKNTLASFIALLYLSYNASPCFAAAAEATTEESLTTGRSRFFNAYDQAIGRMPHAELSTTESGMSFRLPSYDSFLEGVEAGNVVFDVGGGVGYFAEEALARGATVTVLDTDKAALDKLAETHPDVTTSHRSIFDLEDWGFADLVFSSHLGQLLPLDKFADFINTMLGAAKPGGKVIIVLPDFEGVVQKEYGFDSSSEALFREFKSAVLIYSFKEQLMKNFSSLSESDCDLSEEEKEELIEKHGDKARYALDPRRFLPEKLTFLNEKGFELLFDRVYRPEGYSCDVTRTSLEGRKTYLVATLIKPTA